MARSIFNLIRVFTALTLLGCTPIKSFVDTNTLLPENSRLERSVKPHRAQNPTSNEAPEAEPDLLY